MEDKARLYEGHTHKVVFTHIEDGRSRYRRIRDRTDWLRIGFMLIMAVLLSIIAGTAFARPMTISRGMLCQTLDQVKALVETYSLVTGRYGTVEGREFLVAAGRITVEMTVLDVYQTRLATYQLARFNVPELGVRYGYLSVEVRQSQLEI